VILGKGVTAEGCLCGEIAGSCEEEVDRYEEEMKEEHCK
jgi:hypothetical protein